MVTPVLVRSSWISRSEEIAAAEASKGWWCGRRDSMQFIRIESLFGPQQGFLVLGAVCLAQWGPGRRMEAKLHEAMLHKPTRLHQAGGNVFFMAGALKGPPCQHTSE